MCLAPRDPGFGHRTDLASIGRGNRVNACERLEGAGQFVLRVEKDLHRKLAIAAEEQKMSLNALVEGTLASVFSGDASLAKTAAGAVLPPAPRSKAYTLVDPTPKKKGDTLKTGDSIEEPGRKISSKKRSLR